MRYTTIFGDLDDRKRSFTVIDEDFLESPNIALGHETCTSGKGKGIVIKTGKETVHG